MPSFWNISVLTGDQLFLEILNHSLSLTAVILAVFIARRILKKLPRRLTVVLWLIVFFRLLIPFTLESSAGVLPQEEVISPSAAAGVEVPLGSTIDAAQRTIGDTLNGGIEPVWVRTETDTYDLYHSQIWLIVCGYLWPAGMAVMALRSLISFLRLKKRLVGAMRWRDNVWLCDGIDTPFVLGILRPKIYLPSRLSDADRDAILAHEQVHIRHFDPAVKLFSWLGLCLHWFNPLVWLSFHLMVEDMEAACDEAVTASLPMSARADYADTLLRLATGRRTHAAAPLAFGEGDPLGRIRRIFDFQKPKTSLTLLAAAAVVIFGFFLVAENSQEPHLLGGGYAVSEVLYNDTDYEDVVYSRPSSPFEIALSTAPDFTITGDYHLLTMVNERDLDMVDFTPVEKWTDLGQLQRYELGTGELEDMMPLDDRWASSWRPGRVTDAWWLRPENAENGINIFYLFLQTSAGEDLLAIGYEDIGERGQGASDDTCIHYLFRLEPMSGALVLATDYFELDAYHQTGQKAISIGQWENHGESWLLHAFTTEEGGFGFASYQWEGSSGDSQLKDGFLRLMQSAYYPPEELEHYALGVAGCYIAPDPVVTKAGDDPAVSLTIDRTYDAIFIANEEVFSVKRTVTAQDGTVLGVKENKLPTDDQAVITWPRMFLFSWAQEEGLNPCSVSYHFYDKDGSELS